MTAPATTRSTAAAQFWAMKRLRGVDLYEQSLLLFVWLHAGAKHKRFRIADADVLAFLKCGKSKFYAALKACQNRALVEVASCGAGWREYELCWPNIAELMAPEDQRVFFSKLGIPPGGKQGVDLCASRNAFPPDGKIFHHVENPISKEESARKSAPEVQEASPTTTSANTTAQRSGASTRDPWEAVEGELLKRKVREAARAVAEARRRVEPENVLAVIEHWDAVGGLYGPPVQLYLRVRRCHRELGPQHGWCDPQPSLRARDCRHLLAEVRRHCDSSGMVLDDAEFTRRFLWQAVGRGFSKQDARQALALEQLEALA